MNPQPLPSRLRKTIPEHTGACKGRGSAARAPKIAPVTERRKKEIRALFNCGNQRTRGPFHIKEIVEMYKLRIDPGPPDSPEGAA